VIPKGDLRGGEECLEGTTLSKRHRSLGRVRGEKKLERGRKTALSGGGREVNIEAYGKGEFF